MKKVFELLLVLIIFYGVYSVLEQLAPIFFDAPKSFPVIGVSFIVAALLLVLYAAIISGSTKLDTQQEIDILRLDVKSKELLLKEKIKEIQQAQSFKSEVITQAEKTIEDE
jgi:hypothetical protein